MTQHVATEKATMVELLRWDGVFTPAILEDWRDLLRRIPDAPVFLHPEWLGYAAAAGLERPTRLLRISLRGRALALLPLVPRGPGAWMAATPFCMDTAVRLVDPVTAPQAWQGIGTAMRRWPSLGLLSPGMINRAETLAELHAMADAGALPLCDHALDPSYLVPLAGEWPLFLAGLRPSMREKLRRGDQYLARHPDHARVTAAMTPREIAVTLEALFCLYRQRWGGQVGGSPLCPPRNAAFYRTVLPWAVAHDYGALLALSLDGRTLAVGSMLHIPEQPVAYYHFTVRDDTAERLPDALSSPGLVLTGHVIQWAIARGARALCMGRGAADYKRQLGADGRPLWQPVLARSPLAGALLPPLGEGLHILARLPVHLRHHLRRVSRRAA
ncbi:MAG TPA: GNAT family N-acetyltransferase [Armatimonadota bacterium]|nr:GNAT family N-acetyltransferase [Armatimonadota bacterium]HOS42428.1 GNAT family N-acetyltransferase [Armatimonadota bacterium]